MSKLPLGFVPARNANIALDIDLKQLGMQLEPRLNRGLLGPAHWDRPVSLPAYFAQALDFRMFRSRLASRRIAGLQDHTALPYALPLIAKRPSAACARPLRLKRRRKAAPFVCTPGDAHGHPSMESRPAIPRAPDAAASTASRPNVRDDGQRPS